MRDGWIETNLEGIAEYINGYPFKPADLGENGVPVIRIKQLLDPNEPVDRTETETPERCLLRDGDIVFSWSGTLAVRIWNRGTAKLNQHLFRVVEKKGVYKGIIPLILDHAIKELEEKSHGTTMKHITKQTLLPHKVLLPPLPEQKIIVDLISSVDSYIEVLHQQLLSAKKSRNAILHQLLTSSGKNWEQTKLGMISEFIMGQAPLGERCNKNGIGTPFVKAGEFEENRPKIVEWTTDPLKMAKASDVLVCVVGATAGKINLGADCAIGRSVAAVRPSSRLHQLYLYYLLSLELSNLRSGSRGSAQGVITKDDLHRIPVNLPPINKQNEIVEIISSADNFIDQVTTTWRSVKILRSSLLSDLLSGKHEIPASYDKVMGAA